MFSRQEDAVDRVSEQFPKKRTPKVAIVSMDTRKLIRGNPDSPFRLLGPSALPEPDETSSSLGAPMGLILGWSEGGCAGDGSVDGLGHALQVLQSEEPSLAAEWGRDMRCAGLSTWRLVI